MKDRIRVWNFGGFGQKIEDMGGLFELVNFSGRERDRRSRKVGEGMEKGIRKRGENFFFHTSGVFLFLYLFLCYKIILDL